MFLEVDLRIGKRNLHTSFLIEYFQGLIRSGKIIELSKKLHNVLVIGEFLAIGHRALDGYSVS
jgi:hypothetical protein